MRAPHAPNVTTPGLSRIPWRQPRRSVLIALAIVPLVMVAAVGLGADRAANRTASAPRSSSLERTVAPNDGRVGGDGDAVRDLQDAILDAYGLPSAPLPVRGDLDPVHAPDGSPPGEGGFRGLGAQ
jgi:hypothetical protein